ncbi:MAG: hypothetical protein ACP5N2_00120 [Candidatus Nanoarchaeia archaeon]
MGEKSSRLRTVLFEGFSLVALIILFIVMVFTALTTGSSLIFVILGFLPTLATIILCIILFDETVFSLIVIFIIPFVLSGLFYIIASSQEILRTNMDIGALITINLVFSIIYLALFLFIAKLVPGEKKRNTETTEKKQEHLQPHSPAHAAVQHRPSTIKEYVASIEDKSKALNFVIGRVYNKYHGGSKKIREKISIRPEWYNEFSEALQNETAPDRTRLLLVLDNIEKQLSLMAISEKDLLSLELLSELKNLERDEEGNDRIIDVLIKNDKDPVQTYYDGAKEFCLKLRDILQ